MRVSKVRQSNRYDTPNFYIIIGLTIFLLVEGKQKIDNLPKQNIAKRNLQLFKIYR